MKKDIVVGSDLEPIFNSVALWAWADISENYYFYKLYNKIFGVHIYVTKESKEGEELKEWLNKDENENDEAITRKSFYYLKEYISWSDILELLEKEHKCGYDDGYYNAQSNIRKALGM